MTVKRQAKFELGIWLSLFNWQALTVSVANNFGGPNGSDKRDWLAGQISEIIAQEPSTDVEDIEVVLLQVMQDEFDVNVEDDSEVAVAEQIMKIREETSEGDFSTVDRLYQRWEEKKGRAADVGNIQVIEHTGADGGDDEDFDEDDEDDEMEDAPPLVRAAPPREKQQPEVDDEGFTKVTKRGNRR